MDLDQRTRMIGGNSGRIILLGDGTEVLTDAPDQDSDMFDQSEDEDVKDLENEVRKGQLESQGDEDDSEHDHGSTSTSSEQQETDEQRKAGTGPGTTPDEPKMMAATDSIPQDELKKRVESSSH